MAPRVPARLTKREGRRFAFPVGLAFLALAALLTWRHASTAGTVAAALGALLLLAGLVLPDRLGPVQRAWMALALAISRVTTPIIMGILYFLVLTPVGVIARLFGHRPLVHKGASLWIDRPVGQRRSNLERQF